MRKLIESLRKYVPYRRGKLRFWLVNTGFVLFALTLTRLQPTAFAIGTTLLLTGMALHFFSKGHLRQNQVLTKTGPYRWVRNPFYLANGFIDLGICLMINRPDLTLIYFVLWSCVYLKTIKEEEKKLELLFGNEFREYKARVPRLIPYRPPSRVGGAEPAFSRSNPNLASGLEVSRLLRFTSYPLLFYIASELPKGRALFLSGEYRFALLALSGLVSLCWLSYAAKVLLKEKRLPLPGPASSSSAQTIFVMSLLGFLFFFNYLEIETDQIVFGFGLPISCLLVFFMLFSPERVWLSYRARLTIECLTLFILSFLAELPWCALIPLCYYLPMIIHGKETSLIPVSGPSFWTFREYAQGSFRIKSLAIFILGIGLMLLKESLY